MANFHRDIRDIRNSAHNIENHAADAARSTASSARSNAQTAQAAQSAATGAWVGAGFQAVTAFQTARAARAQEEQLQLQHAMAEQEKLHQFAMWRQTPDGIAFVQWRARAVALAQFIRERDSMWLQGWARAIGRAQTETPEEEKQRYVKHFPKLKQTGLKVWAIIVFALAALAGLGALIQLGMMKLGESYHAEKLAAWQECVDQVAAGNEFYYQELCDQINPGAAATPVIQAVIWAVVFLAAAVALLVLRASRRRAAQADRTVPNEAQARIDRWGFDPLAVQPGYQAFAWYESQNVSGYADRLMQLALHGHTQFPAQSQLIKLVIPASWGPNQQHPVEVNEVLTWFQQQERPAIA